MPPPPLPPPTHFMASGYQLPYGHHLEDRSLMPTYTSPDYMLPRPGPQGLHQQSVNPALQAQNAHYQTPYHMSQVSGQVVLPPPNRSIIAQPTKPVSSAPGLQQKPKQTKPRAKAVAKAAKVTKAKVSKTKQRPQNSKHLTPSLRAAIITLKVTDPARSFKEIGEILALPAGFDDDEDNDDDGDAQEGNDAVENKDTNVSKDAETSTVAEDTILSNGPDDSAKSAPDGQGNIPTAEIGTSNGQSAVTSTSTTTTGSKPRTKDKNARRPIPRNTVAGIFKRAADRAGTDSDLYKMLEQTGRQAGSGRPKKGTGKKDLARAAAAAEAAQPPINPGLSNGNINGGAKIPVTQQNEHHDSVWQAMDDVHIPLDDDDTGSAMGDINMDGLDMDEDDEDGGVPGGWESDTGEPGDQAGPGDGIPIAATNGS